MFDKIYIEGQLVRRDIDTWLAKQRQKMLDESGLSQTTEAVLWVLFAITVVGIVSGVISTFLTTKAAQIK